MGKKEGGGATKQNWWDVVTIARYICRKFLFTMKEMEKEREIQLM